MAEYIDLDEKIVVFDTRGTERETTVRHILEMNKCSYTAADVRPVVRGRWEWDVLDGTPGYRPVVLCCSNCHRVSFSGWDYCPNCGADMREES